MTEFKSKINNYIRYKCDTYWEKKTNVEKGAVSEKF
jgi:hypothetical protein